MGPIAWTKSNVSTVFAYAFAHKVRSVITVLVILGGMYVAYSKIAPSSEATKYVLGTVSSSTIISTVSAAGQVSTTDSVDVKAKVNGEITWVNVKAGDMVKAGQALAYIDSTDQKQAIADAEQSIAQAKLQFQRDEAQAPIDYQKSLETLETAKDDLKTTYNDTFNSLSNAYLDLPSAVTGMQNTLYAYDLSQNKSQWNVDVFKNLASADNDAVDTFAGVAERDYKIAREKYDQAVLDYKTVTRYSSEEDLEKLLTSSVDTTTAIAQALQSELNLLDAVVDDLTAHNKSVNSSISTMRANTRSYLSTSNSNLSTLLKQQQSIDAAKKSIRDNERSIEIYKIGNPAGDDPISLQSSRQSIADQERKLAELKAELSDYVVISPFDGVVSSVTAKKGDISSGTIASVVTTRKIAQLSVNEVDAARLQVGQKATLSFDAIDDLTLTGKIAEIDAVGTVSQGVVSYTVKIDFDELEAEIKSGMTVNANIITDVRQDVLAVPSSAVKTQGERSYVLAFVPPLANAGDSSGIESAQEPVQIPVTIGISDDTNIEVRTGLTAGQQIVTRTISGTTQTTTSSSNTRSFGGPGIRL